MSSGAVASVDLEIGRVDLRTGAVAWGDGQAVRLTSRERELLRFLVERSGEDVPRDTLLTEVWGYADAVLSRACDNAVRRLRRKIEREPSTPRHLLTVHGVGYRFVPLAPAECVEPAPIRAVGVDGVRLGDLRLQLSQHRAVGPAGAIALTAQEIALLRRLIEADGAPVDRIALARVIGGSAARGRATEHAIRRLRVKLEPEPSAPRFLLTERGAGYRLCGVQSPTVRDAEPGFVGREAEQEQLRALLRPGWWVLVTGPGGIGKTRLVRRVLASLAAPAWWVSCAAATELDELCGAVATALELDPGPGDLVAQVARGLAHHIEGVVVLDNLEQATPVLAGAVAAWRAAAPRLAMVGTSRVRLGLPDEHCLDLGPLPLHDGQALYLDRAIAVGAAGWRAARHQSAVRRLVRRLDGHPLAIELAAGRSTVLSPADFVARLDHDLLATSTGPHRSLRLAFDRSYRLLRADQARAFLGLALFGPGGFDLHDADALVGDGAMDVVQALRDHSLVTTDFTSASATFVVLQVLRDYAASLRAAAEDGADIEVAWGRSLARLGEPEHVQTLFYVGREAALARQRRLGPDLLRAARLLAEHGEYPAAARCVVGARPTRRVPPVVLRDVGRQIASRPLPHRDAAWLGTAVATLDLALGDGAAAAMGALRALDEARSAGDRLVEGWANSLRAQTASHEIDGERAAAHWARAGECCADAGYPSLAHHYQGLAAVAMGRREEGYATLARVETCESGRDRRTIAHTLRELSWLDRLAGRTRLAHQRLVRAGAIFRAYDDVHGGALTSFNLVELALWTGEGHDVLDEVGTRSLELARREGSLLFEAVTLTHWAWCLWLGGDVEEAEARQAEAARVAGDGVDTTPYLAGTVGLFSAQLALATGMPEVALAAVERALAGLRADRDEPVHLLDGVHAECLAELDRPERAAREAARLLDVCRKNEVQAYLALAAAKAGRVAWRSGDGEGARARLAEAEAAAPRSGITSPVAWPQAEIDALRDALSA